MPPKVATRSSLENVAIIDAMLSRLQGATLMDMCSSLECSEKTVRRHLQWMKRKFGVRVVEHRANTYELWIRYEDGYQSIFTKAARQHIEGARQ